MGIQPSDLLTYVIRPTIRDMGADYDEPGIDILLLATLAQESHCGHWLHQIGGPALGAYMVEPYTHWLVWDWAKRNAPEQVPRIQPNDNRLVTDLQYATTIARLLYASWGIGLPGNGADDHWQAFELWDTYKKRYNSALGAATYEQFRHNWRTYVAPEL